VRLETRDQRILAETFLSKVVRRDDLIDFGYFSSVPRCNSRLLSLRSEGLLKARTELGGMELRATLYHCTSKGVRIAAEVLDISQDEAIEVHRSGIRELAIKHALRCNDLRSRFLKELSKSRELRLDGWSQELLCHHEFQVSGKSVVIKPDGLATLSGPSGIRLLFIEVDLGNASIPKIREKLNRYQTYASSGAFSEAYESKSFKVLLVTTDERRLAHLQRLSVGGALTLTTWKRLASYGLLGPVLATEHADGLGLVEVIS
jgi:hypothetical protein